MNDHILEALMSRYDITSRPQAVSFRDLVSGVNGCDRATHLIHTYPAKLLAHIPKFFLQNDVLSSPGDTVLDPFCGSGTVLLESLLAGRSAIGVDVNPLACLISKVKTTPIDPARLRRALAAVIQRTETGGSSDDPDVINMDYWFTARVKRQLKKLKVAINASRNQDLRDFFLVCLSQCIRKVCLADPRFSVPVRLRHNKYPEGHTLRERYNRHLDNLERIKVNAVFEAIAEANIERMRQFVVDADLSNYSRAILGDIRHLCNGSLNAEDQRQHHIERSSVDLVITSPPYPGAQKYIRASSLSLGWLELCDSATMPVLKDRVIGREETRANGTKRLSKTGIAVADRFVSYVWNRNRTRAQIAATYVEEMKSAMSVVAHALKRGGSLVIIVGDGHFVGRRFPNHEITQAICEDAGLRTRLVLTDKIRSRALQTKRHCTSRVMQKEWVMLFTK
ncbi:MAG TPA: DNA methyltransferase [Acidobacteriota bacterium]|nr:DNA methyltransferase [Acidobacteriota bacterium]